MKKGTRRVGLLLASMMLMLAVVGGVASAVTLVGNAYPNTIKGTDGLDKLDGRGGNDLMNGRHGADSMWGARGSDTLYDGPLGEQSTDYLYGGPGDDVINTNNQGDHKDVISCGPGYDQVIGDRIDVYGGNPSACEDVRVY